MIRFHIVTLFQNICEPYVGDSILQRAIKNKKIKVHFYNPRDYVKGKFKKKWPDGNTMRIVDDRPYGGGPGMVLRAEPIIDCVLKIKQKLEKRNFRQNKKNKIKIIITSAGGTLFNTTYAQKTAHTYTDVIIVCGRYEGIDERVREVLKGENVSIGDFVLTGGELPALVMVDSISRQIEGVLGNFDSREETRVSSHSVYTRPEVLLYNKKKYRVPPILLSGNHKEMNQWKEKSE